MVRRVLRRKVSKMAVWGGDLNLPTVFFSSVLDTILFSSWRSPPRSLRNASSLLAVPPPTDPNSPDSWTVSCCTCPQLLAWDLAHKFVVEHARTCAVSTCFSPSLLFAKPHCWPLSFSNSSGPFSSKIFFCKVASGLLKFRTENDIDIYSQYWDSTA